MVDPSSPLAVPHLVWLLAAAGLLVVGSRFLLAWPRFPNWAVPPTTELGGAVAGCLLAVLSPGADLATSAGWLRVAAFGFGGYLGGRGIGRPMAARELSRSSQPPTSPTGGGGKPPEKRSGGSDLARVALAWGALLCVSCTPGEAKVGHVLVDGGEAACVAAMRAEFPGLEGLCAWGADYLDELIDAQTKKLAARSAPPPGAPDPGARLLAAAKRARAAKGAK